MRGAGLRLDNDVRRVWQCAACGAERKVGAQVTTVRCQCAGRPAMKLIEGMRHERPLKELSSPYLEFVFEPGELAPPRSQVEEAPPPPVDDLPLDAVTSAAIENEVNEGGPAPSEEGGQRPAQSQPQRPPRRDDQRGDRGPASARGPQGRSDNGPRREPPKQSPPRDQPSRKNQRGPGEPRPDQPGGNAPAGQNAPRRDKPPRRQNDRRDDRSAPPTPAADNSGFGEGIAEERPPESPT